MGSRIAPAGGPARKMLQNAARNPCASKRPTCRSWVRSFSHAPLFSPLPRLRRRLPYPTRL